MSDVTELTVTPLPAESVKVQQVLTWMLEGSSDYEIRKAIEDNWPGDAAEPLILTAIAKVNESGNTDHSTVENWAFEATRFIYTKQLELGDYAGASKSIRQLREISAARTKQQPPPKNVEHYHQHELGPVTQGTLDEHRQRLAARIDGLRQDG